jgi:HSP20 family protein
MFASFMNFGGSLFDEIRRMHEELDEIFGSAVPGDIRSLPRGSFPAVNVASTPDAVTVYLFAPGIDPKALDVSIQQNLLTITGRREVEIDADADYYRQERFNGEFRRAISLPDGIDPDRVEARYRDGIVQIQLQRREAARPRQIAVH